MSVTAPSGFRAAGVAAGLKDSGRDVALVVNDGPLDVAAGVFTANRVKAAPVLWSEQVLVSHQVKAVVLNAKYANACTGAMGFEITHRTAETVAGALGIGAGEVAVCSTGKIGEPPPLDRLDAGVAAAVAALSPDGGAAAADAIRTTDTVSKEAAAARDGWTVGGMAKGAGMLAPALATMLCVITTDAVVSPGDLDAALRSATRLTFDRVDSDGCLSTNDTVLLLASGASGVTPSYDDLAGAVLEVCADLARQLIADAEGASKDLEIEVRGAATEDEAVDVARAISRSNLLKCALHGEDPNWGRILSAVGTTGAKFDPLTLDAAINGVWVCRDSAPGDDPAVVDMSGRDITIVVDLKAGDASATVWSNDLTAAYVHENSAYST
ncbi:MAG: bifunctional glutamate N-acetyltransferase/amino-acid acetyltransferase ArgJ [Frankiaceae bacterium]|nr:bifunctional glutamate N-acetyltransferase/amino-acid acetyltransferase ArgJ [Frankiaceae bacterium]MBV9870727.1 bifunctional glutamate N-acetyltransferase/amino-acid acetyltransferase ArgJ [Frankiaceae bacterium]